MVFLWRKEIFMERDSTRSQETDSDIGMDCGRSLRFCVPHRKRPLPFVRGEAVSGCMKQLSGDSAEKVPYDDVIRQPGYPPYRYFGSYAVYLFSTPLSVTLIPDEIFKIKHAFIVSVFAGKGA